MQYTNSEIDRLISEQIHNERNRRIMHLRLVDGLTYEQIAESVDMSARHVKRIVKKSLGIIIPDQKVFTEICFS
jgi:RNA polymerase sigma factor (sigma-70 family)